MADTPCVAANSNDASIMAEEEGIVRMETNESNATTSTNNSRRNRITVFTDVEVARDISASPKSTKISQKASTLSSYDADSQSLNGVMSENEDNDDLSDHGDGGEQEAGDPTGELKFPIGTHVYVEYRRIFYSSTVLQTRRKRKLIEYLVHYEGYKKSSDRWVKESSLHDVTPETTRRFEEQRLTSSSIALQPDLSGPADSTMTTRGKSNVYDDQSLRVGPDRIRLISPNSVTLNLVLPFFLGQLYLWS
jgi:hypothetical protein